MADLNGEPGICDVCGRSMLAGERTRTYLTRDREEREVCDLCLVRAESADWTPRELAGAQRPERREGGGAVRRLFGRARESAATLTRPQPPEEGGPEEHSEKRVRAAETADQNGSEKPRRARRATRRPAAEEDERPRAEPAAAEARPRRRSVPQKPERRIRRAFESFNLSEYKSTVRSLIRSLGGPYVCAVTTNEDPSIVRITVAWELSWYQYEVDITSEAEAVRELGRGDELSQLSAEDQAWNAHAAEDGELRTGLIGSQADG
jgi:hypothetical protein